MTWQKNMWTDTVQAGADLSALQYKCIQVAGTLATDNSNAYGTLQNKPLSGEHATVCVLGNSKAIAADTIAKGAVLSVSSGYLITASSGDYVVGKAVTAAASGDTFTAAINFINGASH